MMTVSNVINGTGKVSDQTRARVRQAIRNTGYVPNYEARRLASGGCSRIALLCSDQQTRTFPGCGNKSFWLRSMPAQPTGLSCLSVRAIVQPRDRPRSWC